jgi:ABC-type dipeptide/oligopeptide/nickel transport system permease component
LRNAAIPIVSLVGLRIGGLLAGTVLVESVFAVPGVGRMMADAVVARDFPVVQGGVLVVATMVVAVNALTDLASGSLDPRLQP